MLYRPATTSIRCRVFSPLSLIVTVYWKLISTMYEGKTYVIFIILLLNCLNRRNGEKIAKTSRVVVLIKCSRKHANSTGSLKAIVAVWYLFYRSCLCYSTSFQRYSKVPFSTSSSLQHVHWYILDTYFSTAVLPKGNLLLATFHRLCPVLLSSLVGLIL
jgi:hypothetical protein